MSDLFRGEERLHTPVLRFFLVCVPPTANHQRKRIVTVRKFSRLADKPELVAAKAMLDELLLPHQPVAPVLGPVVVHLEFTWPWVASRHGKAGTRKRARFEQHGRVVHDSKPDCSNAAKTLEDRLVALRFIEDDRKVADLRVTKWWGARPGIGVSVAPFQERQGFPP